MKLKWASLIGIGLDYMIRLFYVIYIFLLSACAYVEYSQIPNTISKILLGGKDIEVTQDYINKSDFSFAKVRLGKSDASIFVLSRVNQNNEYEWVSSEREKLITKNGKIIALYTEPSLSFRYINPGKFRLFPFIDKENFLLEFQSPKAMFNQVISVKKIEISQGDFDDSYLLFSESVVSEKFKWNYENKYWMDEKSRVVKTQQYIHPSLKMATVEFYYKY